ncbi:MAG: hypothetical protein K2P81_14540 [Bacteriovoracaceae bacterium]|nr:hypothetical protein [Bacteriovoracaceae bacterium]
MKFTLFVTTLLLAFSAQAQISLWPTIPFVRGADLCQFSESYGQSRQQTLQAAAGIARQFLQFGASGREALQMLMKLDELVDKNRQLATQGFGLDVTLESTLRGYTDDLYRRLNPRQKKILFTQSAPLAELVQTYRDGQRPGWINNEMLDLLSGFAYGTYSYAPGCRGELVVTLTVITKGGKTETFMATNKPEYVMGDIASRMFEAYQRTTFPTTLRYRDSKITLLGGLNGSVDRARTTEQAEMACETLDARLPTKEEYEGISMYGDWSGGVSLNDGTWALAGGLVYHAPFHDYPVRKPWEVNETEYLYYCVK